MKRISWGIFLTRTALALVAGCAAAIAFIGVVDHVRDHQADRFDLAISTWLRRFDSPVIDVFMRMVTLLGSFAIIVCVVIMVAAWAVRRQARVLAIVLVAVACASKGLELLLKSAFQRTRPDLIVEIVIPRSFSFPSGHTLVATAAYGMTAVVICRLEPRLRARVIIATVLFVLMVGTSRVYLGVHWATDVLAGFATGGLILISALLAIGHARNAPPVQQS